MPLTISNTEPREDYDIGGTPTTGPHNITWEFFALTDIRFFVDGEEWDYNASPGAGEFSVTGTPADDGLGYSGGYVTTGESLSNKTVTLLGSIPITRDTNFQLSGQFPIKVLNQQLNKIFAILKQILVTAKRALALPDDEAGPITIPSATSRANKYLGFDADGNPEARELADIGAVVISDAVPQAVGTAAAGTSDAVSRADHVHAPTVPSLAEARAASDNAKQMSALRVMNSIAHRSVAGLARNLAVRTHASNPNTQLTITADELIVRSAEEVYRLGSVSETLDITVGGAGGLDTGAEANSTWYYGHVIYNPTTGDVSVVGSLSATAPTLPSGYTASALVCAVYNDSGGNFIKFRQFGRQAFFEAQRSAVSGGAATVETAVALTALIPAVAQTFFAWLECLIITNAGAGQNSSLVRVVSGSEFVKGHAQDTAAGATSYDDIVFEAPNIGQNFYYLNATGGSVTAATTTIAIIGFTLPIGGV